MNNEDINQEELGVPQNSNEPNMNVEDIPDELFAPMGNQVFEKPTENKEELKESVPPLEQAININNEKMTLEEEAKAVRKYELGEKGYNPKLKKYIIIFVFIFLTCIIGFYFFYNSSEIVFSRGVTSGYKKVNHAVQDITTSSFFTMTQKNIITNEIGISFQSTVERGYNNKSIKEALEALKNFSVKGKIQTSRKDKKTVGSLNIKSGIYKALDFSFNSQNDKITMKLANAYKDPFYVSWKGYSSIFNEENKTTEQFEDVTKQIKKKFQSFIKSNEIKVTKENISIDGNEKKLKKLTLSLSEEESKEFINILLEDNEIITFLEKITGSTKEKIRKKIETSIDKMDLSKGVTFSIYVQGFWNKAVGYEFTTLGNNPIFVQLIEDKNFKKAIIQQNNQSILEYETNGKSGEIHFKDYEVILKNTEMKENKKVYQYTLYKNESELFKGNITSTKTNSKSKKDGLITIDMSLLEEDKTVVTTRMDINYSTYIQDRISTMQVENEVAYESLSQTDKDKIKNRFIKNSQLLEIEQKLKNISNMEVTDRNTTRYTYSCIDIINQLLKATKEKHPKFTLEGNHILTKDGIMQGNKVIFRLDNERMLLYPDTVSVQNQITIKNNQVVSAKLKFDDYYVTYNIINQDNPIFITKKSFK